MNNQNPRKNIMQNKESKNMTMSDLNLNDIN